MRLPPGHRLAVEDKPAVADVNALANGLEAYNEGRWPGLWTSYPLSSAR
jgi:hypothetical protein